jgi:acetyl-CoA acetyltransferase
MPFTASAITGFAERPSSKTPEGLSALAMIAGLARDAIADAGLEKDRVDGLLVTVPVFGYSAFFPSVVADNLGLSLGYFDVVELGGASSAGMIWRAAAAIEAGLCNHVLCVTADLSGGGHTPFGMLLPPGDNEFEQPFGASPPNAGYAMIARRHMHEFGTSPEQLAKIAVSQRANALKTPGALFGDTPLTIDEVLGSKLIFDPLHLYEIVSPCTGGAAVILSRKSEAPRTAHPRVALIGAGEAGSHTSITSRRDITTSWARDSAAKAFAMAGLAPDRADFAQIYDCYTIAVLMFLEDIGFCAKGHGGGFVAERDMGFAGDFPCNTNGGQLSYGQAGAAGGMTHVVEGVRQLMGRAGERQVANAAIGVVHGNGGVMSDQVTLILAQEG